MSSLLNRRKFISKGLTAAAIAGLGSAGIWRLLRRTGEEKVTGEPGRPPQNSQPKSGGEDDRLSQGEAEKVMQKRALGKTGFQVGLFSLGGEATVQLRNRREEAQEIIHRALDLGVNYIDTAPTYGGGGSEENIGEVMKSRRKEVFLASKTGDRTYDGTMRLIEESLQRLNTDYLDLYQVHNVRVNEDVDRALGKDGAVQAMEKLKNEGVIKHLGISGHKDPEVLLRGIREYDFDCLLMALNAGDPHYRPFQESLLEAAVEKEMGIIAMKVTAVGRIFQQEGIHSMQQALGYVLSLPISTAIVGISSLEELAENVSLAADFTPFSREKKTYLEELVFPYQEDANFFKYRW